MRKFEEADYKYCPKCECIFPVVCFYKDIKYVDNLCLYCKFCSKQYNKQYYRKPENAFVRSIYHKKRYRSKNGEVALKHNIKAKQRNDVLRMNGMCTKCGKNPINRLRSAWYCTECLNKKKEIGKRKRAEQRFYDSFGV